MNQLRNFVKDRKALSPLFVSLYLAILAILLISTLFIALHVSSSALTERMRIEQERMQESITLVGPEALNLTEGTIVHMLRVNNTGSITVRIRALYIDHTFVCDPSEFAGDAYIEPKEALWIQLYPNVNPPILWNDTTIEGYWTVTTERSTRASEVGGELKYGNPWIPYSPNKFYFGPLMLVFDMFHWRVGADPWRSGWTIPKGTGVGAKEGVTWRILLVNVDDRDIIITDTSCLTLISNDNSPKDPLPWYIDPTLSETTLKPGIFNFVHYTWSKPFSEGGTKPQDVTMKELTTCITFLTFYGSFVEPDGTLTPFGQTIPFEAVLITTESMAASVDLTSAPENIKNDGISTSTITAMITDDSGSAVSDAWVDFYTTAGTLSTTHSTTDTNGVTSVALTSSLSRTTAHVTAICQGVEGACKVTFTPSSRIDVEAEPNAVSKDGGTSQITVQLKDADDQTVTQSGVTITVEVSSWTGSGGKKPTLTYESQNGYLVTVTTDSNGKAIITLAAQGGKGNATITASASGLSSGNTMVDIID
jgi:hypothetical protein